LTGPHAGTAAHAACHPPNHRRVSMAKLVGKLTAELLVRVNDGEAVSLGTFDVPVTSTENGVLIDVIGSIGTALTEAAQAVHQMPNELLPQTAHD
jgi:hypothetical protein